MKLEIETTVTQKEEKSIILTEAIILRIVKDAYPDLPDASSISFEEDRCVVSWSVIKVESSSHPVGN